MPLPVAAMRGISADVPLYSTRGGRFASLDNPAQGEVTPWGRIEVILPEGGCGPGRVRHAPEQPGWPAGEYPIHRLSPQIEGLRFVCHRSDAHLVLPEDAGAP